MRANKPQTILRRNGDELRALPVSGCEALWFIVQTRQFYLVIFASTRKRCGPRLATGAHEQPLAREMIPLDTDSTHHY